MEYVTLGALGATAPFSGAEADFSAGLHHYFTRGEGQNWEKKPAKMANLRRMRAVQSSE